MEIIILGSGTGVPRLKRRAPGLIVEIENEPFLFDSGSGTCYQILRAGVNLKNINHIFYTHFIHPDHISDLPEILFASKYDLPVRGSNLNITGPVGIRNFYQNIIRLFPIFEGLPFVVNINEVMDDQIMLSKGFITTKPMNHYQVDCLGYRIEFEGKSVVYTGDTDYCDNVVELANGADLLITECSFPDELKIEGHLSPIKAGQIAVDAQVKRLLLTHLYPPCEDYNIKKQTEKIYKGEVIIAEDLMRIEV